MYGEKKKKNQPQNKALELFHFHSWDIFGPDQAPTQVWLNTSSDFSEAHKHQGPRNEPDRNRERGCSDQTAICSVGSHTVSVLLIQEVWKVGFRFQTRFQNSGQTFCLSLAYFLVKYTLSSLSQSLLMASKKRWLFILPADGYDSYAFIFFLLGPKYQTFQIAQARSAISLHFPKIPHEKLLKR